MDPKSFAASAAKFDAIKALGRTDDMLAIIGIIMLLGVIISAYGAYWQGTLAKATYKNDCDCKKPEGAETVETKKSTTRYIILITAVSLAVIGIIIYLIRRRNNAAAAASSVPS